MTRHPSEPAPTIPEEGSAELRRKLDRSLRWHKTRALLLISPLLIFVLISFLFPIGDMLFRSVENGIVSEHLPRTVTSLQAWEPEVDESPGEEVFRSFYADLRIATDLRRHTRVGSRLNYEAPGIASQFRKGGRETKRLDLPEFAGLFADLDPGWLESSWLQGRFSDARLRDLLPNSARALDVWTQRNSSGGQPDDYFYVSLAVELRALGASGLADLGSDAGEMLQTAHSRLGELDGVSLKDKFIEFDDRWTDPNVWRGIRIYSPKLTEGYFLNAVDLKKGFEGPEARDETERIYIRIFIRTMIMSMTITLVCMVLGYPIAFYLAHQPLSRANLLLILVLLPFWTSLLVRTSAWKVLLQQEGVINDTLVALRIIDNSERFIMINNQFGTIVAMSHILLPFMILPLYSVMKTIPESYVRAARSLGANSWTAFRRIYFPQTMAGIGAGSVLVFILSIGYYITPELVGGTKGTFISNRIAYHISSSLNWGLAAALATILFGIVLVLYWTYDRLVGIDNVKLG